MAKTTRFDSDLHVEGSADVSGDFEVGGTLYADVSSEAMFVETLVVTDATLGNDLTIADGGNVILNELTGTQIGTAVTQKLGFFGAPPVVPTEVDSASGTLAADLHAALLSLGLITEPEA